MNVLLCVIQSRIVNHNRKKKRFLSPDDKREICLLYANGETCQSISEKFDSDPSWVRRVAQDGGVWKGKSERYKNIGRSMNDSQVSKMIELHKSGMSYPRIAEKLGRTRASINNTALKEGLIGHTRKYEIDENWLDEIDCPEKAIFLGLFFADGCNFSKTNLCEIFLQERDVEYLEKFRRLFTDKPLIKRRMSELDSRWKDQYGIQIFSKTWTDNLSRFGAVPKKTFLLTGVEHLPAKYEKYFIRGLFEGDGCLHRSKQGYFYFSLVGPLAFMEFCQKLILKRTGAKLNIYKDKGHLNDTFILRTPKQSDAKKVLNWIYSDELHLVMSRKYKKAQECFDAFYALFLKDAE